MKRVGMIALLATIVCLFPMVRADDANRAPLGQLALHLHARVDHTGLDRRRGGGGGERSDQEPERDEEDRDEGSDQFGFHAPCRRQGRSDSGMTRVGKRCQFSEALPCPGPVPLALFTSRGR